MSTFIAPNPSPPAYPIIRDDELYEVIDGKRVRTPPMGIFAVWLASRLARFLGNFADDALGHVVTEGLFHLPAPVNRGRRPDVAFVSYERWPKSRPIAPTDNAWEVVPNLATEIVSPTDTAQEVQDKINEYFQVGVQLVWIVYPLHHHFYIYTSPTHAVILTRTDVLDGGAVIPGFRLPLADLFPQASVPSNGSHPAPQ